jgi:hypothetical protein
MWGASSRATSALDKVADLPQSIIQYEVLPVI